MSSVPLPPQPPRPSRGWLRGRGPVSRPDSPAPATVGTGLSLSGGILALLAVAAAQPPTPRLPSTNSDLVALGPITIDARARTASFPVRVNMTNGMIEYALVADYGKKHESLLVTDVPAIQLHSALLLLHAQPAGTNALAPDHALPVPTNAALVIEVSWDAAGGRVSRRLEELVDLMEPRTLTSTGQLARAPWLFNGSYVTPEGYGAHFDGSYIALIRDPVAVINNPRGDAGDDEIHAPARGTPLPAPGTPATLTLRPDPASAPAWNRSLPRTP